MSVQHFIASNRMRYLGQHVGSTDNISIARSAASMCQTFIYLFTMLQPIMFCLFYQLKWRELHVFSELTTSTPPTGLLKGQSFFSHRHQLDVDSVELPVKPSCCEMFKFQKLTLISTLRCKTNTYLLMYTVRAAWGKMFYFLRLISPGEHAHFTSTIHAWLNV